MELRVYAPEDAASAVRAALARALGASGDIGAPEPVPEERWSEAWKAGLEAVEISPRLVVRPPFAEAALRPGQVEVVIPPGQAFGTGAHESTRLALEAMDEALQAERAATVLDVGTGSGVLALAALRLGAARAVGIDLDPVAVAEARRNARAHGLGARLALFAGPLEALAPARFDLVLANLLRQELEPILPALAGRVAGGGRIVLSGLLASERAPVAGRLAELGLGSVAERIRTDRDGVAWIALTAAREPGCASRP